MSRRLEVLLHNRPVGFLSDIPSGGIEFRLLDAYRDLVPRPVLGQRFEDDLERVHRNRKGEKLPDFFANMIPEGRLRNIIEESASLETGDDLALLAFVGRDLPGAVVVQPLEDEGEDSFSNDLSTSPMEDEGDAANEGLRFSLAGVQLKFSMLREDEKLTLPAKDSSGEWIAKLDSLTFPRLPENEFSMLEWGRAAGFDIPECHLHNSEDLMGFPGSYAPSGSKVLAIRRYDRLPTGRIHQEDFVQALGLPPRRKFGQLTYDDMAGLVRRFIDGDAVEEMMRRLVFTIACGNNDAHLKNWSLIYPDTIRAHWSPLYDQVATIAWKGPDRKLALKLGGIEEFNRIEPNTMLRFAERAKIDKRRALELVTDTLKRLRIGWREIFPNLPIPNAHAEALREHWRKVPLLRAAGPLD